MDLSTDYLGLKLKNPIIASSSPLTWELKDVLALQDSGASAIIMPSMFEEQIEHEQAQMDHFIHQQSIGNAEAESYHPMIGDYEEYLEKYTRRLQLLKTELDIPLIASLNGTTDGGWIEYAHELQQAGADALELNVYYIAANPEESSATVEQRYIDLLSAIRQQVTIPVCMKLSHQFSSITPLIIQLEQNGAAGVSLFNRFYQPDIDLDTLEIKPRLELSNSTEAMLRIRWIAILRHQVDMTLAITGGMHNAEDILKGLLAGADVTCMCSALLQNGTGHIKQTLEQITHWMEEKEYDSVEQLKGSLSYANAINPAAFERTNYLEVLDHYSYAAGVIV